MNLSAMRQMDLSYGVLMFVLSLGCSSSKDPASVVQAEGEATGSVCPPASTLTYESFAKPFAEKYCTRCHSSQLKGDARNGAPLGHDFDSAAGIIAVGHHVDENAAAGPDAVNVIMPPSDPKPTEAERRQLGEWLACNPPPDGGPEI